MGTEVINKNRNCVFNGPYAGCDLYITMFQDNEREFVVTHNVNIKPISYFTGREIELQDLRRRIEEGRKSVLISGMGGIGKTHICRKLFEEYLKKHADAVNEPFRHIGYIEYDGDMGSSLQNCLKFRQQDEAKRNQEAAWRELEYLASDGKLLLFVDNVDKPITADPGLQKLRSIPGAIVLTSWQVLFGNEFEPYPIGFLDVEQCLEIYEKIRFAGSRRKVRAEEYPELIYIIEKLAGRHTITVEYLAHLARTKLWTAERLRDELEEKGFCLEFHKDGELVNIQESYEKLYDLSELTEAEQNILEAFSVFPYIPLAAETCNEWLLADARAEEDDDILMGLCQKGWIQFEPEQESYAMHPVFAQFIFGKCRPDIEHHSGLIEGCQRFLSMWDKGMTMECKKYIPFAENILEKMEMKRSEKQPQFMESLADLFLHVGQYQEAVSLYGKLLEVHRERGGENLMDVAEIYHRMAYAYWFWDEYEKAEEWFGKSLCIYERKWGDQYESIANICSNLAGVYVDEGEYGKAEEWYEKSLSICERFLGEEHQSTVTVMNNLTVLYRRQGNYGKAEELYGKKLRACAERLGENHAATALYCFNLAGMYVEQGEYGRAEELYEKSLKICKMLYGENHIIVAERYLGLASVCRKQGKNDKAKELCQKSMRIYEKVLEGNHLDAAIGYNKLAVEYYRQGDNKNGMDCFFKAYKVFASRLGLNHIKTKVVYKNMELAFSEWKPKGDFDQWLEGKMKD